MIYHNMKNNANLGIILGRTKGYAKKATKELSDAALFHL